MVDDKDSAAAVADVGYKAQVVYSAKKSWQTQKEKKDNNVAKTPKKPAAGLMDPKAKSPVRPAKTSVAVPNAKMRASSRASTASASKEGLSPRPSKAKLMSPRPRISAAPPSPRQAEEVNDAVKDQVKTGARPSVDMSSFKAKMAEAAERRRSSFGMLIDPGLAQGLAVAAAVLENKENEASSITITAGTSLTASPDGEQTGTQSGTQLGAQASLKSSTPISKKKPGRTLQTARTYAFETADEVGADTEQSSSKSKALESRLSLGDNDLRKKLLQENAEVTSKPEVGENPKFQSLGSSERSKLHSSTSEPAVNVSSNLEQDKSNVVGKEKPNMNMKQHPLQQRFNKKMNAKSAKAGTLEGTAGTDSAPEGSSYTGQVKSYKDLGLKLRGTLQGVRAGVRMTLQKKQMDDLNTLLSVGTSGYPEPVFLTNEQPPNATTARKEAKLGPQLARAFSTLPEMPLWPEQHDALWRNHEEMRKKAEWRLLVREVRKESAYWSEQGDDTSYFGPNGLPQSKKLHKKEADSVSGNDLFLERPLENAGDFFNLSAEVASFSQPMVTFSQPVKKSFDRVRSAPDLLSSSGSMSKMAWMNYEPAFASAGLDSSAGIYPHVIPQVPRELRLGERPTKSLRASAEANGAGRLPDPPFENPPPPESKHVRTDAYPDWMAKEKKAGAEGEQDEDAQSDSGSSYSGSSSSGSSYSSEESMASKATKTSKEKHQSFKASKSDAETMGADAEAEVKVAPKMKAEASEDAAPPAKAPAKGAAEVLASLGIGKAAAPKAAGVREQLRKQVKALKTMGALRGKLGGAEKTASATTSKAAGKLMMPGTGSIASRLSSAAPPRGSAAAPMARPSAAAPMPRPSGAVAASLSVPGKAAAKARS
eukprot:gnl/MRDRNA2_/MRDRNA2_113905_c0_seq1.p1 gnl/MRDRNA2_/MRDRNA2_113905_c0~~gnl/MRDRNA2_/MRDRNA2_113905_c0_seq1.p1  ORF type:complete len:879 (-),score=207.78 gnl/MRDRNA2_/MRDRNA2_113905_c0_seq1:1392-4028(-)